MQEESDVLKKRKSSRVKGFVKEPLLFLISKAMGVVKG